MKSTQYFGVFGQGKKLYTINLVRGNSVYGEALVREGGREYRYWDPYRSKLAAGLLKGLIDLNLKSNSIVLYLGAASGTTLSHISDICKDGLVFGVEFSPEVFADLFLLAKLRGNVVPMLCDATSPETYYHRLVAVDLVYQDIAQRNQVEIFERNCDLFLKRGGRGVLCVKARSIDVAMPPKKLFREIKHRLRAKFRLLDYHVLEPYQRDHAILVIERG
ncbi:fibrillarin-like rRNA/tRNA 2'-O-methyltransferase [Candidatus Woesearchaeota archaeon]|nr:fibrillarin-like rRNA/tRNA 2'-O-methyltransferase [Candidatus Woesearchaeota archaeon]RLE42554.1 MAG: fibrillarin-like rRNA/tRNA 2'-O-methyltransferase [Candidatus Woesearchaeota archaeon]